MTPEEFKLGTLEADVHTLRGQVKAWTMTIERLTASIERVEQQNQFLTKEIDELLRAHRRVSQVVGELRAASKQS
jgi:SMC interacting uncharacterized protein involved in chromosome segregation